MDPGTTIAISIGSFVGILGGVVGTYVGIKNTRGPRERSVAIRCAFLIWSVIISFLAIAFSLPSPWRWLVWIPYSIVIPVTLLYVKKQQDRL